MQTFRHLNVIPSTRSTVAIARQTDPVDDESAPGTGHVPQSASRLAVLLLAAGAGRRFLGEGHKLLADLPATTHEPAETVFERSLRHAREAGVGPVVVVTGAVALDLPTNRDADRDDPIIVCHNPRWSEGQMTSVRAGIDLVRTWGCSGVVVGLADQPSVTPEAWRAVAIAPGPIAVATYESRRANPVRLDAEVWDLLASEGDEGARALMRVRPDLVREVACSGSPDDIDTEEDLRRWQNY
jgi:molybdenum cofactor cytidylyltransferase